MGTGEFIALGQPCDGLASHPGDASPHNFLGQCFLPLSSKKKNKKTSTQIKLRDGLILEVEVKTFYKYHARRSPSLASNQTFQ